MNGVSGPDSDGYNHWSEMKPAQPKSLSPPQPQKQLSDSYSNTLPVRKNVPPKNSYASGEAQSSPSSAPGAPGVPWGWLCRGVLAGSGWQGPVTAAVSRVVGDAAGGGAVSGSIPPASSAAHASGPGVRKRAELGSAVGFRPTDSISRRKILRNLVQGGCSLCRGWWAIPRAVARSCSVRGKAQVKH